MQSDDRAEPIEWDLQELKSAVREWESVASQILTCLDRDLATDRSANWRPHADQIAKAVRAFRDLCHEEAEQLGVWRADGIAADEAYEKVWDEADRLVQWLNRMMR
jgi:hypothetical protein